VSVERVERKGGAVWRVRWRDEQGRERSKVIGRKRDAESFEAEVVRRKRTGDLELLTGGQETLAEFARSDVSESCPPDEDDGEEKQESPANPYNPINLPRISFITSSVPPPIGPRRASRTARSMPYSRM